MGRPRESPWLCGTKAGSERNRLNNLSAGGGSAPTPERRQGCRRTQTEAQNRSERVARFAHRSGAVSRGRSTRVTGTPQGAKAKERVPERTGEGLTRRKARKVRGPEWVRQKVVTCIATRLQGLVRTDALIPARQARRGPVWRVSGTLSRLYLPTRRIRDPYVRWGGRGSP